MIILDFTTLCDICVSDGDFDWCVLGHIHVPIHLLTNAEPQQENKGKGKKKNKERDYGAKITCRRVNEGNSIQNTRRGYKDIPL